MVRHLTPNNPVTSGELKITDPFDNSSSSPPSRSYQGYGYSPNGTTSNLLLSQGSSSLEDSRVQRPSEYDRFPSKIGSRVVSSSSLLLMGYRVRGGIVPVAVGDAKSPVAKEPTDESEESNEKLELLLDFSPFGGYPTSLFPLHIEEKESDDYLHNPDPIKDAQYDKNRFFYDLKNLDRKSLGGLLGVIGLFVAAIAVFVILPVLTYSNVHIVYPKIPILGPEILTYYQYPVLSALRGLVDEDTPQEALTKKIALGGETWQLVFSDEFNVEGRTFYEGDDQYWAAANLWYGATKDLEWYDPDAVTTSKGTLNIRMDAYKNHGLFYRSGMLQSWNKFCFTQGLLEFSARLPNYGEISGLWPGLWSMGNLGRPGYLATTDGVWPYSYDSCDAGITPNQSSPDGISYLPGQKLSSCTCKNEDHPNPGVGRGAPEIDAIEAEVDTNLHVGVASQSIQIAPMDIWYMPNYDFIQIYNKSITTVNTYAGGPFQQAVLGITTLNPNWYEHGIGSFQTYGFEYLNDDNLGYVTWYVGEPTLTVHAWSLSPNGNVGWRRISKEPMSIVMNLGMSNNWAYIDWTSINFPVIMSVDYVRLYQPNDTINLTCDPPGFPTFDYINNHLPAYENVNFTKWEEAGFAFPKNTLVNGCS